MSKWRVNYKYNRHHFAAALVEAETYTMALLEFVVRFPNCEYFSLVKVEDNQYKKEMIK